MKKAVLLFLTFFSLIINFNIFALASNVEISEKQINRKDQYIEVNVKVPIIKTSDGIGKQLTDKINKHTENWVNDLTDLAKHDDVKETGRKFDLYSIFKIAYNKNDILSIPITYYQYTGGAHGITTLYPYNFNMMTGKDLSLKELFKDDFDYKKIMNEVITKEISKDKEVYFNDGKDFKGIKDNQDFYISDEGIVVYFQVYEIAPYSSGIREFLIPKAKIENGLKIKIY